MESIKDIFLSAITVTVLIGYAENLVSDKYRPYIKLISGIFIMLILTYPIINTLYDFSDDVLSFEYESQTGEQSADYSAYIGVFEDKLSESVEDYILRYSKLGKGEFSVDVILNSENTENVVIEAILITVDGDAKESVPLNMIEAFYGCRAEVTYINEKNN